MSTTTKKSKTSEADNDRFNEIEALVTTPANKERLVAAETADELRTIAEELGVDTSDDSKDMGKFIYKLKIIGVDFPAMAKADAAQRRAGLADKAEAMAERADDLPFVRLWSGAVENEQDASGAYGIVDADGTAIWYGGFSTRFEKIRKAGDLISAEQSAADKAVYAASKVREAAGLEEISLWLTTTCPELDEAALKTSGARLGVAVDITVDDEDESAVRMAEAPGYRNLKNVTTEELTALVETESEDEDDPAEDEGADE
ncbi:hypothetical protein ACT3SZ_14925 [Corynebacterium sp. AOP40-9SA-29]|uniref:hypothetical protein n=1 Tax=Corynebacterium sp. AOP40-9SA-29 TaxID=3457677 RepID=UPI004034C71D